MQESTKRQNYKIAPPHQVPKQMNRETGGNIKEKVKQLGIFTFL